MPVDIRAEQGRYAALPRHFPQSLLTHRRGCVCVAPAVSSAGGAPARRTYAGAILPCGESPPPNERWVTPTPAQRPCGWHGRSRGSPGRGPSGANVEVGQSVAGGSDQPVRGVMLTQAPHRYVRRSITPGGVTVRLTHRPPQPNPSMKKKKEPAFSSSFGSGCPHGDALR